MRQINDGRPRQVTLLENTTCPYCGVALSVSTRTKEHVVGRRFVPRGSLNSSWNLVLWACEACNRKKADLEDDASAISMQPDAVGRSYSPLPGSAAEAKRKAKGSISRRTGKPVAASAEKLVIETTLMPGLTATFDMSAPPQLDETRLFEVARLQMSALFYLLTFDEGTGIGHFWMGKFFGANATARTDWGNPRQRWMMDLSRGWLPRLVLVNAGGSFRAAIRRHPTDEVWAWALEWNGNLRAVGLFGNEARANEILEGLPGLEISMFDGPDGSRFGFRQETLLEDEHDVMFAQPTDG